MKKTLFIGRDPNNDIIIYDLTDTVSRSHATLRIDGKKTFITDHSTNGTYLNGLRLQSNLEYRVSKKDEIRFADAAYLDWNALPLKRRFPVWAIILCVVLLLAVIASLFYFLHKGKDTIIADPASVTRTEEANAEKKDSTANQVRLPGTEEKKNEAQPGKVASKASRKADRAQKKNNDGYKDEDDRSSVDAL